jgi:ketosteroid isomerase-like protein
MREWLSAWEGLELSAEELIEIGDRVVVPFCVRARGKGSGAEVERRWAHVWTFRDGKAVMFEVFMSKEAALRTLGGN